LANTMQTNFLSKCNILGKMWTEYSDSEELKDFFEYNDIGLPLAYAISQKLANATDIGEQWIEETWDILMESLSIEDTGFENVNDIFASAEVK